MRAATTCFAVGMIGVVVILVLFVLGRSELPLWLTMGAVALTSLGFFLGLVALFREARSA